MQDLLEHSLETATHDGKKWRDTENEEGSPEGHFVNWLPIRDRTGSVCEDVTRIRSHPLMSPGVTIYGFLYDVKSGLLQEVPEATHIGTAA